MRSRRWWLFGNAKTTRLVVYHLTPKVYFENALISGRSPTTVKKRPHRRKSEPTHRGPAIGRRGLPTAARSGGTGDRPLHCFQFSSKARLCTRPLASPAGEPPRAPSTIATPRSVRSAHYGRSLYGQTSPAASRTPALGALARPNKARPLRSPGLPTASSASSPSASRSSPRRSPC